MTHTYRFMEPVDVLFMRGNKLFGAPGSYGESLVPPWPSLAAGAIRSRMLVDEDIDLKRFAKGQIEHPQLGTPQKPGDFTVTAFQLARRHADGRVEILVQPPADLVVSADSGGKLALRRLRPGPLPKGLQSSAPLPLLPILPEDQRRKPVGDRWLTQADWQACLEGRLPSVDQLVETRQLWKIDERIGVGLDPATRSAREGQLFTTQAVSMVKQDHVVEAEEKDPRRAGYDVGFLVAIQGAEPPQDGSLRFGGDGRAATIRPADQYTPVAVDYEKIVHAGRCRLILTTPGLFEKGWLPTGVQRRDDGSYLFDLHGVRGRLVCAAVARAETISGWDLAQKQPKPAQRVAPAGSVYWLNDLQATPEALGKLAKRGLWSDECEDASRRAEGFNRFVFAID